MTELKAQKQDRVEDILPDDLLPNEGGELVTYFSPRRYYQLTLRAARKTSVNGFVETIPGYKAEFREHHFRTRDPVMIKAMDKLLEGPRARHFRARYRKMPTEKQQAAYSRRAEAIKKAKDEVDKKFAVTSAISEVEEFKTLKKKAESQKTKYINSGSGQV